MKEETPDPNAKLLLQLSEEVRRIAGSLAQLSIGAGAAPPEHYPFSNENDLDVRPERVNWLIKARRARGRYLTPELFADPAWDILLDLLRAEIEHERISVSSACIAAAVPATTGLRWLNALEQRGLVVRHRDLHDARRSYVTLSSGTSLALRRYFVEVVGSQPSEGR